MLNIFKVAEKIASEAPGADWARTFSPHVDDLRLAIDWSFSAAGETRLGIELTVASIAPSMQISLMEECLGRVIKAREALAHLEPAEGCPADRAQWAMKLAAGQGACLLFQSAGEQTGIAFRRALELAETNGDVEYQLRGLWGCWSHAYLNGKYKESLELAARFETIALQSSSSGDRTVAGRLAAISLLCLGQPAAALARLDACCSEATRRQHRIRFLYDERTMLYCVRSQALSFLGRNKLSEQSATQALHEAMALGHAGSICYALSEAACPAALLRADLPALDLAARALTDATQRHGVSTWKARAAMWNGLVSLLRGEIAAYEDAIAPALDEIDEAQYSCVLIPFLAETALMLSRLGDTRGAQELLERALDRASRAGDLFAWCELLRAKAETMLLQAASAAAASQDLALQLLLHTAQLAQRRGFVAWEERCATSLKHHGLAVSGVAPVAAIEHGAWV